MNADYRYIEFRGFAPIGILEYWNTGMMGLNEFCRFFKKNLFTSTPNIPIFHHSIIPYKFAIRIVGSE